MSWSPEFFRALADGRPRIHLFRSIRAPEELVPTDGWTVRSDGSGTVGVGPVTGAGTVAAGASAGARITPKTWRAAMGRWVVPLVGDPSVLLRRCWRGQLVEHRIGFPGWGEDRFERVQIGAVHGMTGHPGAFQVEVRDIIGTLQSRYAEDAQRWPIFHRLATQPGGAWGEEAETAEQFTAGSSTTLDLDDASSFSGETGGNRLIVVDPEAEDRFFWLYTGKSGNTLTGGSTADVYGTTQVTKPSGTTVRGVALIEGHPFDVVRKILTSTGAGTNGDYDTLPESWGLGLPSRLIDHADIDFWKPYFSPASGSDEWGFIAEEEVVNPLQWLQDALSRAGLWLTTRQGKLTIRGASDPNRTYTSLAGKRPPAAATLTTGDLSDTAPRSIRWSAWDGSQGAESWRIRVVTASGTGFAVERVRSHPAEVRTEMDLSDRIWTNESAWRDQILARLRVWALRLSERLEVEVAHPRYRGLCPGDVVELALGGVSPEYRRGGLSGVRGMVLRVDPDWWGARPTKIVIGVPPPNPQVVG